MAVGTLVASGECEKVKKKRGGGSRKSSRVENSKSLNSNQVGEGFI